MVFRLQAVAFMNNFLSKYILIFCILLLNSYASAGMFNISSRYLSKNGTTHLDVIKGSAFLVGYSKSTIFRAENVAFDRYFLVTASHVTQGEENKIELTMESEEGEIVPLISYDDQSPIIGRLSDNWNDVEIIEVDKKFVFKNKLKPLVYGRIGSEQALINSFVEDETTNKIRAGGKGFYFTEYLFSFLNSSYNRFFSLFPNKRSFERINKSWQDRENYSIFDVHFLSHFKIGNSLRPGMSGTPLLSQVKDYPSYFALRGVGIQYDKFFRESIYVSGISLNLLFGDYFKGKRGLLGSSPNWRNINGKTVREWRTFVENRDLNVGGKGEVGESENSSFVSIDDGSDAEIIWKNQKVFGIKLNSKETGDFSNYLWANIASLEVISNQSLDQINSRLILEKDLNAEVLKKLMVAKSDANKSFWDFISIKKASSIEYGKDKLKSLSECSVMISPNSSIVEINMIDVNGLSLRHTLDLNSKFRAAVSVGDGTTSYLLDIKQLFFTDLFELPYVNERSGKYNPEVYSNGLILKYQQMMPTPGAVEYLSCELEKD